MDNLQKTFKESYCKLLREQVRNGIELERYSAETFPIDDSQVKYLANTYQLPGLSERLDPDDDFKTGVALYEHLKGLTPLAATSEALWTYLTHVDCFSYVKQRWPFEKTDDVASHIESHWFKDISSNGIRATLMGDWWSVYRSVDTTPGIADPYHLTRILYTNQTFRTRTMGSSVLFRDRNAVIGILSFLEMYPDILNNLEARGKYITQYLNRIGGTRQLSYLGADFFIHTLEEKLDVIYSIKERDFDKELLNM